MPLPARTATPALLVPVLVCSALLALPGCGSDAPEQAATPSSPTSSAASPSVSPSAEDTPSGPSSAPSSSTPGTAPTLRDLLLPASELPGFNEAWSWSTRRTGPESGPTGVCDRLPLSTIGADKSLERSYLPAGDLTGGTATQVVARFVDDTSTGQALAVLRSWHDRCADRLSSYPVKKVGAIAPVQTAHGTAFQYLVGYRPKGGAGRFDALGVLRSGTTVEVLLLRLQGQDYSYPAGGDPMTQALQKAAARLP